MSSPVSWTAERMVPPRDSRPWRSAPQLAQGHVGHVQVERGPRRAPRQDGDQRAGQGRPASSQGTGSSPHRIDTARHRRPKWAAGEGGAHRARVHGRAPDVDPVVDARQHEVGAGAEAAHAGEDDGQGRRPVDAVGGDARPGPRSRRSRSRPRRGSGRARRRRPLRCSRPWGPPRRPRGRWRRPPGQGGDARGAHAVVVGDQDAQTRPSEPGAACDSGTTIPVPVPTRHPSPRCRRDTPAPSTARGPFACHRPDGRPPRVSSTTSGTDGTRSSSPRWAPPSAPTPWTASPVIDGFGVDRHVRLGPGPGPGPVAQPTR